MKRNNVPVNVKEPCPFCGGKAIREIDRDDNFPLIYYCSITCTQCTANISLTWVAPKGLKWPDQAAARFITKAWNRRWAGDEQQPSRKRSGGEAPEED